MEQDGRTEPATAKKRIEERKKGNVAKTPDLNAALILLAGFLLFSFLAAATVETLAEFMRRTLTSLPIKNISFEYLMKTGTEAVWVYVKTAGPFLLAAAAIGIAASIAQVKFVISFDHLKDMASKFNAIKGMKKFFTLNSFVSLGKNLIKIIIVSAIAYKLLENNFYQIILFTGRSAFYIVDKLTAIIFTLGSRIAMLMVVVAILDYFYQKKQHEKKIMMTKEEVKQEHKQQEGDPMLKGKRKSRQLELSRNRMMAAVPDADVVITNPTTYAVAMKYVSEYNAPVVTAKGMRLIAKKIKETAIENDVPIIENKFVAQALYKSVEIGQEVPPTLYKAVAEILAYVYKLKNKYMGMESI